MNKNNNNPILTQEQIAQLKHYSDQFKNTSQLYTLKSDPLTMMPYRYGEAIDSFVKFCFENEFVKGDYSAIEKELTVNYEVPEWYTTLNVQQLLLCFCFFIRRDRFVDGFLAARIVDGTVNKVLDELINRH